MENLSFGHIFMSLLFVSGGTVGGWALTFKLAGEEAALSFLYAGLVVVLIMLLAQVVFFAAGKKRMLCRVLFNISFISGIAWFMMCLLLPVAWLESVTRGEKALLFIFLLAICAANVSKGRENFKLGWRKKGESALLRCYNSRESTVDWPNVIAPMQLSVELYVPGVPASMGPFILLAIVLLMLLGLSLRNSFPTFSLFAWGIPSCFVISLVAQMIGICVAQVAKLRALEKKYGTEIAPKN